MIPGERIPTGRIVELTGLRDFELHPDKGGFTLCRDSGNTTVPWARTREDDPVWAFGVVGTQYRPGGIENLQGERFAPGAPVRLVPERDNPHDPYAIGIWDWDSTVHAGYVPREWSQTLWGSLTRDLELSAWVVWEKFERRKRTKAWVMVLHT